MNWTRVLLYSGLGIVVIALPLGVIAFTIGKGQIINGPGISLALSACMLVLCARFLFQSARVLVANTADAEAQEQKAASGRRRKELEREYYNLKRALKELELDHAMSKVSAEDYQEIRSRYRERAVRVLRQLDQGESYRAQIEADLRARRTALELSPASAPSAAAPAASTVASAEGNIAAPASPSGACSACATRNDSDAVFCKKCGHRLIAA